MEIEMSNPSSTQLTSHLKHESPLSSSTSTPPFYDLEQKMVELPPLSPNRCIYRVPKRLRSVNEKAYTPQLVSIGPLHHGHESLAAMEEHKMRFARDHLARSDVVFGLDHFMNIIKEKEEQLRGCYAERIGFSSDEFVRIVLVDALFIIELILRTLYPNEHMMNDESDYIFGRPHMLFDIIPDLLLIENQLPFFILDELFCLNIYDKSGTKLLMTRLSKIFICRLLHSDRTTNILESNSFSTIDHFVELLRKFEVPTKPEARERKVMSSSYLPTATKLHQFGVDFEVSKGKELFDIQFSNGVLKIPKLTIFDPTELMIRNVISFEQCHDKNRYASDYAVFMSSLVRTSEDVELLVKYGIIENCIGDNSHLAAMIYKLSDGVNLRGKFYFAQIFDQLKSHCEIPWNKHKANLKQNYFNSPWTTIKVIAASLIIILTFIQTICSVISTVYDLSSG